VAKERFYSDDQSTRERALGVARLVLSQSLSLLHPFMPFLTEEIRETLAIGDGSVLERSRKAAGEFPHDAEAEHVMGSVIGIVEAVRNIRGEMGIHPSKSVAVYLKFSTDDGHKDAVVAAQPYIARMARVSAVNCGTVPERERPVATSVVDGVEIAVPLGDVIDVEVEKARLGKEIMRLERLLEKARSKVGNKEFNRKAPPHVVTRENEKIEQLSESMTKLKKNLSVLLDS
jgi:valyl-tRNA synthetase